MTEFEQPTLPEKKPDSMTLLKVLCILTFVGSGIQAISNLAVAAFFDQFILVAKSLMGTFKLPGLELIMQSRPLFFGLSSLFYVGSFFGALMMWNLKKSGFHIYTVSQILLLLTPMYFFHLPGPSVFDMLISGIFVYLYSRNRKFMV
ncbi:MAG: hypothetical protein WCL00_00285 [Bacteroidota bacterium]